MPWLAQSYKVAKDLRSITLTVRPGIKFHDGTDCDAEAIKWNLERYRLSDNPELKVVASIDVPNHSAVRLNLSKWDSTLVGSLAGIPGMIISPTAYKTHDDEWCRTHPVGTGPFKFVSWQKEVRTKYEKFDSYWQKGKPYLDGIEFVTITDPVTRAAAFKRGEVDDLINVVPKDAKELTASGSGYTVAVKASPLVFLPRRQRPSEFTPFEHQGETRYRVRSRQAGPSRHLCPWLGKNSEPVCTSGGLGRKPESSRLPL